MHWPESPALMAPLGDWFESHRRELPWRALELDGIHPDPYAVLVSELMLQQTQVATVIPYFKRWMERFPDASSLSDASDDEIHKFWEGLGYYRRARHLRASAQHIANHGWPTDIKGLIQLPGLGPYTAAAVASIAFQRPEPALDGNAFRVLARLLGIEGDPRLHAEPLRSWLRPALEKQGASRMTQGLMELGAMICTPDPKCGKCPLSVQCEARIMNATDRIPPIIQRIKPKESEIWLVAVEADGHWLLLEPAQKGLLAGLWKWPSVEAARLVGENLAAESGDTYTSHDLRSWPGWTQVYTHRREVVSPLHLRLEQRFEAPGGCRWIAAEDMARLALGKRDQRLRDLSKETGMAPLNDPPVASLLALIKHGANPVL